MASIDYINLFNFFKLSFDAEEAVSSYAFTNKTSVSIIENIICLNKILIFYSLLLK